MTPMAHRGPSSPRTPAPDEGSSSAPPPQNPLVDNHENQDLLQDTNPEPAVALASNGTNQSQVPMNPATVAQVTHNSGVPAHVPPVSNNQTTPPRSLDAASLLSDVAEAAREGARRLAAGEQPDYRAGTTSTSRRGSRVLSGADAQDTNRQNRNGLHLPSNPITEDGGSPSFTHVASQGDVTSVQSGLARRRRPTAADIGIKPGVFDGNGGFATFKNKFINVARLNGWDEDDKMVALPACLEGDALTLYQRWARTNEIPSTSSAFMDKLQEVFTDVRMERSASRRLFQGIRQEKGEGIDRFLIRFSNLAAQANITCEEELMERWLAAVDPNIARSIVGERFTRLADMTQRSVVAYHNYAFIRHDEPAAVIANLEVNDRRSGEKHNTSIDGRIDRLEALMEKLILKGDEERRSYGYRRDHQYQNRYRSPSPRRYDDNSWQRGDRSRSPWRYGGGNGQGYRGDGYGRANGQGTDFRCTNCGGFDHMASYCRHKERVCFTCHKPGHDARHCPEDPQDQRARAPSPVQQSQGN